MWEESSCRPRSKSIGRVIFTFATFFLNSVLWMYIVYLFSSAMIMSPYAHLVVCYNVNLMCSFRGLQWAQACTLRVTQTASVRRVETEWKAQKDFLHNTELQNWNKLKQPCSENRGTGLLTLHHVAFQSSDYKESSSLLVWSINYKSESQDIPTSAASINGWNTPLMPKIHNLIFIIWTQE